MSRYTRSRREFLKSSAYGLGALSIGGMIVPNAFAGIEDPLAPKAPHFTPKAKSVIWLHMAGAPSSLDLFDYKPDLVRLHGQPMPDSFRKNLKTATDGGVQALYATKRTWKQYGETGAWMSDWLPNLATQVDNIAFLKGSKTDGSTHVISSLKLHTSGLVPGRPALGAWVTYGLGSANPDLPPFVVLPTGTGSAGGGRGSTIWSSGFLPATYQGTALRPGDSPMLYIDRPAVVSAAEQRGTLDLLKTLNDHETQVLHPGDGELEARSRSYELAYRMQKTAPEAVDLSK